MQTEKTMAKQNQQKLSDKIETENLYISDNIMKWNRTIIQLTNVCSVSTDTYEEKMPVNMYIYGIYGAIAGLVMLLIPIGLIQFLGLMVLVGAVALLFYVYKQRSNPQKIMTLTIIMNSGRSYDFVFYDDDFKLEVLQVLETIISYANRTNAMQIGDINIDIKNSRINGDLSFLNDNKGGF